MTFTYPHLAPIDYCLTAPDFLCKMYNADGSLKTVGKGRYKGGNSGGGSTSLGFGDKYEALCFFVCEQLDISCSSVALLKTR